MTSPIVPAASRRRFLQYLAGSPLFAPGAISAYAKEAASKLPDPMIWAQADGELIKSPQDAINVFDFEPVAHKNVPLRPPRGVPRLTTSAVASVDSIGRRAVSADEVRGAVAGKRKPHETLDVGRDGSLG
jgi:hypothetical protein